MKPRTLWLIFVLLLIVATSIIWGDVNSNTNNSKKISGETASINSEKTVFELAKPPLKKNQSQPEINSKVYYLIDVASFYSMAAKNENIEVPIASTTKIATALVVLENHSKNLQDEVTIIQKMISVEGSDIQLQVGEKISVENLLNGLLIMSGNDTAYALAEYFGGKDKFVEEMNKKINEIGLKNTKFFDPAGLNDQGYSTARDLAVLAAHALKNQKFSEIVRIPEKTIYSNDGLISHELKNSNRMMRSEEAYYYPLAIGIKTGFTYAAGHVLVSAAEQDEHRILAVVLHTDEDSIQASARESKKLLEWGFDNWIWK